MSLSSVYNIIQKVLDLLFPPSERVQEVRRLSVNDINRLPADRQPKKDFIKGVCDYTDKTVRKVVQAAKYDGDSTAVELISEILREELPAICEESRVFADKIVMVPIPLSTTRRQERGFNQSLRIAQAIEKKDESNTFKTRPVLEKIRETPAQTHLTKNERKKNLAGAFRVKPGTEIKKRVVIVIDDVTTTGATLTEARRALQEITSAKIIGVAFAH